MLFLVHKNNIEISEDELVNEGEVNVTTCHFTFDSEYGTLAKKAIFTNTVQGLPYEVPITNDECLVPGEVCNAEGKILVGVYAYEIEDDKVVLRYSPKPVKIEISEGSYVPDPANPGKITPTQYELYEEALNSALDRLNQEIAKVDEALESGELNGPANTLEIGTVERGAVAAATITGEAPNQTLNLVLPKGDTGATGPANTLTIGTVVSGTTASATITGTSPNQTLNLVLPKGDTGPQGTTDFDDLTNRPSYNGTVMDSTTNIPEVVTYTDFTGTDGVDAGTAGLVPAPATTDAGKFLKADGTWDTAGGSSVTVVQTTGTSTTDVMSQDATSKMIYPFLSTTYPDRINIRAASGSDSSTGESAVAIGTGSYARGERSITIGRNAENYVSGDRCVTIGNFAKTHNNSKGVAIGNLTTCANASSIALGSNATTSRVGELNIGAGSSGEGYNSTNYRVIGGVHDGQDAHDAATVAQGNTLSTAAPDTSTVGVLGQLWTDTTNMHTYQCTAISGSTYTWTQRW